MNNLSIYQPSIYEGVLETDTIIDVENQLFNTLNTQTIKVKNNQFILIADIDGIIEYEKILNIIPNPSTEDIEFRRERIINRLSTTPPFTFRFLQNKLNDIIGVGNWTAYIDHNNYTLYVESSASNQLWFHEILVTMTKIKPANIVFVNKPLLSHNIEAGEEINLHQVTFNYRLGTTWVLGRKPFVSLENMGVIKLPTNPSIQPALLNSIATFTAAEIAKVRINESLVKTTFETKSATNNIATIEYEVSETDGINEVTKIELLDTNDNILTSSIVYIPVLERIILKHNIPIKEEV